MGIASFVLACLGLFCFWIPFVGMAPSIAAIVLGAIGMRRARALRRKGEEADSGLAIAGLVLALVMLLPAGGCTLIGAAAATGQGQDAEDQDVTRL